MEDSYATPMGTQAFDTSTWNLIWCHERCYKLENEPTRKMLQEHAPAHGAFVILLRKAAQLALWLDCHPQKPYVLLSDWREARPCIKVLRGDFRRVRPQQMIVLCESPKQLQRASGWSLYADRNTSPIQVADRANIDPCLLNGLVTACFSAPHTQFAHDDDEDAPTASSAQSSTKSSESLNTGNWNFAEVKPRVSEPFWSSYFSHGIQRSLDDVMNNAAGPIDISTATTTVSSGLFTAYSLDEADWSVSSVRSHGVNVLPKAGCSSLQIHQDEYVGEDDGNTISI